MRAVAVLLVLGRHGQQPTLWKSIGWVGVDLFFVLSGFLISGLLFTEYKKTGAIDWKRFFIRRGLKIYPAFYCMIFVTFLGRAALHEKNPLSWYLPQLFFYQNYGDSDLWGHTWSLAVEEHFYILLPVLLLLLIRFQKSAYGNPFRLIPILWVILALGCLGQRVLLARTALSDFFAMTTVLFPTHLRIDSLFFGVLLSYLHHFQPGVLELVSVGWRRIVLLGVSVLLVCTCLIFSATSFFMLSFGLTALYLGFGGILIFVLRGLPGSSTGWSQKLKIADLLAFVGMYSYSIYLWHGMVLHGFMRLFWRSIGEKGVFYYGYVLTSLAVGIVLSRLIEFPVLHLRDRWFPSIPANVAGGSTHGSNPQRDSSRALRV